MGGTFSTSCDNSINGNEDIQNSLKTAIVEVPKDNDKQNLTTLLEEISKQPEDSNDSSTDKPHVTIEIFGSEDENSKGFYINDYKITPHNLDKTFSPNDQVEHFLTNVFGYIENEHNPKEEQQPKTNFFHSYKETVNIEPTKEEEEEKEQSGGKKKRSRKHKPKYRHRKTKKH